MNQVAVYVYWSAVASCRFPHTIFDLGYCDDMALYFPALKGCNTAKWCDNLYFPDCLHPHSHDILQGCMIQFLQPIPITDYDLLMADTNKITDTFTWFFFSSKLKKFLACSLCTLENKKGSDLMRKDGWMKENCIRSQSMPHFFHFLVCSQWWAPHHPWWPCLSLIDLRSQTDLKVHTTN